MIAILRSSNMFSANGIRNNGASRKNKNCTAALAEAIKRREKTCELRRVVDAAIGAPPDAPDDYNSRTCQWRGDVQYLRWKRAVEIASRTEAASGARYKTAEIYEWLLIMDLQNSKSNP